MSSFEGAGDSPPSSRPPAPDLINHPPHYRGDGLEAIEVIEDWGLGFHLGNAVKYLLRADKKGAAFCDVQKALWYLRRARRLPADALRAPDARPYRIAVGTVAAAFALDCDRRWALYAIRCAAWSNSMSETQAMLSTAVQAIERVERAITRPPGFGFVSTGADP